MSLTPVQAAYLGRLATQLSDTRLAPYLRVEKGDLGRALARYYWNAELGRAYFPVLQALEVALRNTLDRVVAPAFPVHGRYHDIDSWIDREPRVAVHRGADGQIAKAKDAILRRNAATGDWIADPRKAHGDLLAATSFGFWVGLLEDAYADPGTRGVVLWPRFERDVFPGAGGTGMTAVRVAFSQLRHFRNRVFHHEPVWPKRGTDPTPQARYDSILEALRWVGGEQSRVPGRLHRRPEALDEAAQLSEMHRRLLETVDAILEEARAKVDEKAAKKAARRAAKAVARGSATVPDTENERGSAPDLERQAETP